VLGELRAKTFSMLKFSSAKELIYIKCMLKNFHLELFITSSSSIFIGSLHITGKPCRVLLPR
jgi:hypothetical protein